MQNSLSKVSGSVEPHALAHFLNAKAALVVAHPGHELCVHGWLSEANPVVFVLTDGSGRQGIPRLSSTTRNITDAGAQPGKFYGRLTDAVIYQALLKNDSSFFTGLAIELADELIAGDFDYVVGDAVEGYNPTHDVCRLLINTAVNIANRTRNGSPIQNFDFAIVRPPNPEALEDRNGLIRFVLDEESYARKVEAMRSCPELDDEVRAGLDGAGLRKLELLGDLIDEVRELVKVRGGAASFRIECLRPVDGLNIGGFDDQAPFYERYAEKLVAAGLYQHVIRYREHVLPVAEVLRELSGAASLSATA